MKALFKKELKTLFPVAIIGLIVCGGLTAACANAFGSLDEPTAIGLEMMLKFTVLWAAITVSMGQVQDFYQKDQWSFTAHRPLGLSAMFWAKMLVGIPSYLLVSGTAMMGLILWERDQSSPQLISSLTMRLAANALLGICVYFAGFTLFSANRNVLCRLLCAAFTWSLCFFNWDTMAGPPFGLSIPNHLWADMIMIAGAIMLQAGAAWISFTSIANAEHPSSTARFYMGSVIILGALVAPLTAARIPGDFHTSTFTLYEATRSGEPFAQTRSLGSDRFLSWTDAHSIVHKTTSPEEADQFPMFGPDTVFAPWAFDRRKGVLRCYGPGHVEICTIDRSGFVDKADHALQPFKGDVGVWPFASNHILIIGTYRVEIANVARKTIDGRYMAPPGDWIVGATPLYLRGSRAVRDEVAEQFAVLTDHRLVVLSKNGQPLITRRYALDYKVQSPGSIEIAWLPIDTGYILFTAAAPAWKSMDPVNIDPLSATKTDVENAIRLDKNGNLIAQWHLHGAIRPADHSYMVVRSVLLPGTSLLPGLIKSSLTASALSALLCAILLLVIARRLRWSRADTASWVAGGLVLGPALVLAALALHAWPALVPCVSCGKKRIVTRELCEHCGAAWPNPARDGTEIFGDLASVK